jgi:hypothetical protein
MFNRIPGQLLRMCEPGRSNVTQVDRKIHDFLPLPPATVVQQKPQRVPRFSRLHLSGGGHRLLLARVTRAQLIRIGETYSPTTMELARTVICD